MDIFLFVLIILLFFADIAYIAYWIFKYKCKKYGKGKGEEK